MKTFEGPIRALVARGAGGTSVVLATDSSWLAADIDNITDGVDDIGLESPPDPGLWLWEGSAKLVPGGSWDSLEPPEPEYTGTYRWVDPSELQQLLDMEPPEVCCICGKLATTHYPHDESGEPSCGSMLCELQMQRAMDFHDECGDR